MEDLIASLKDACAGLTVDDIAAQLVDCPAVPADKAPALAAYLASLNEA